MSEENVEIVLQQMDAFNRRDPDAFVALLSPDVEWEDPTFWSEGARTYHGRAEVREWLNRILEPWDSIHIKANEIAQTSDDQVFVDGVLTGRGKTSGVETELRIWAVAWFAKGLCTRRRVFRERSEALEAAGLSE
jgi:ketosteroid isomerase-like protein